MKATGIVRRIDDLGRIVIPKEIRRTMLIREGDPLEIYVDGTGGIIFKKYSPVKELGAMASDITEAVSKASGQSSVVFDRDGIAAHSGIPKSLAENAKMSGKLKKLCEERKTYFHTGEDMNVFENGDGNYFVLASCPISADGEIVGCTAVVSDERTSKADSEGLLKTVCSASYFLGRQLSN